MRLRPLPDPDHLPALDQRHALRRPGDGLAAESPHPPRILSAIATAHQRP
jgi:arsenic resistance protein ArsH